MNENLLVIGSVSALSLGLIYLFFQRFTAAAILNWHEAKAANTQDPLWSKVQQQLESLARRSRLKYPRLFVIKEFAPNAFVLPSPYTSTVVLSEGLIHCLNSEELESILALCLAQIKLREYRSGPRLAFLLHPFVSLINWLPAPLFLLASSLPCFVIRIFSRTKKTYRADKLASSLCGKPLSLASALQKISLISQNLDLNAWSLEMDHMYIVSPMQSRGSMLQFFPSHPRLEDRVERLHRLR